MAVEGELVKRAVAIADYTDISVFIPELVKDSVEVPPDWFGLNPEDSEDSAEVIDSSDEGEEAEDEDSEEDAPEVGGDGQPQPDRASSNDPRSSAPTAAEGNQAETNQPSALAAGAANSVV